MSEQAEPSNGEPGSIHVEPTFPHSSDTATSPVAAAQDVPVTANSPSLVPEPGAAVKAPEVKADVVKDVAKETRQETRKESAPRMPGKVMIMSAADRTWAHEDASEPETHAEPSQPMFDKRRLAALVAMVALAVIAGAVGGAMATMNLQNSVNHDVAPPAAHPALDAAVTRIDTDILALKASVERTSKMSVSQFNKTSDRLDKVEKAQAEPAAKLAKLSEAVEKLHALPAAPPVVAAAPPPAPREVTGSVNQPVAAAAPKPADVKSEIGRLPTVDSWVLRDVANGGAVIEGRQGIFEVYAGDPVPGLGRVDAIRRQDGRWVVVTSKGLIVAR